MHAQSAHQGTRLPFWSSFGLSFLLPLLAFAGFCPAVLAQAPGPPGEIAWSIGYDPSTFDPAKVDDQASELIRFLTGGVLVRLNRSTLRPEPELAESWTLSPDGRQLTFRLRKGLHFSDGSPLTSRDAAESIHRVLLPATAAPVAEEFLSPEKVRVETPDPLTVRVLLPRRVAAIENVFDEIAIEPAGRPHESRVTSGPFSVQDYRRGVFVRLARNPFFWKKDAAGQALPYLSSVRLDMVSNPEAEQLRFLRGEYSLIQDVPASVFDGLSRRAPGAFRDLGPSLNTEQLWFNLAPNAPLPAWEKAWFANRSFRLAVSEAIHRADLARIAFSGHATPAASFISPANRAWNNAAVPPPVQDTRAALETLSRAGFRKQGSQLVDSAGHPVRFSILTNAGNLQRERMAVLIQQDLAALGMQVNVVRLDFPAMIERLMHSAEYEAALLGLSNVQPDPSSMMNIWLSSSPNHQWNPHESSPATPWEAEIDRLMHVQAEAADFKTRRQAIDRVQAIVAEQLPFIYLVYPNVLCAVSPQLKNARLSVLQPSVVSEIEQIRAGAGKP